MRQAVAIIEDDGTPPSLAFRTIDDGDWKAEGRQFKKRLFKPKRPFDKSIFTKRELTIMERLSEFFKELRADDMSEFSHRARLPWSRVFRNGEGDKQPIPYESALESEPIMHETPTIDEDERRYRELLLSGL